VRLAALIGSPAKPSTILSPLFLTLHFLLSQPPTPHFLLSTTPLPRRGPILAPRLFEPKMDFFRSTQWAMARGTYKSRSQIVFTLASLSTLPTLNSSISFPSSQIQASSHGQTIVGITPSLSPPTLDGSRTPRRNIGEARQISAGWLASTVAQTQYDQSHRMVQASLGQVRDL
jgi:hypothetical protein